MKKLLIFFILFLSSIIAKGKPVFPEVKKNRQKIIKDYMKIHTKFRKEMCKPGTEEKFWKIFRTFRGNGYYIPLTLNEKIDKNNLNRYIPEVALKVGWIDSQIKYLKKHKNFRPYRAEIDELQIILNDLMILKQDYFLSKGLGKRSVAKTKSTYLMLKFSDKYRSFLKKIPFLMSYRSTPEKPVDHFELRENYDEFKGTKDPIEKVRLNEVYFYRKIVQDGAQNPNNYGRDTFLRAAIDTSLVELKNEDDFISEPLRFDLTWILKSIDRHLRNGVKIKLKRLGEWKSRTQRTLSFYKSLRDNKVRVDDHYETGDQVVESKSKARFALKNFVLENQVKSYNFWKNYPTLMQSIYSMETILFNEVGSYERKDTFERRDVSQVVINRVSDPEYNYIPVDSQLYEFFNPEMKRPKPITKNPWLNVLFKEGEFSFTYYFIDGNLRVHCPDMTKRGRKLRLDNINIALDLLGNPNFDFRGVRYFSRASMLGRIDMSPLWEDFHEIAERPGRLIGNSQVLQKAIKKRNFRYFYQYRDPTNRLIYVIEVNDKVYSYDPDKKLFFSYRSPHFFRYFQNKPNNKL